MSTAPHRLLKTPSGFPIAMLLAGLLFVAPGLAQDYTRFSLPDGALVRLGKGTVHFVAYSPDGALLAVAGGAGIWLYDAHTGEEVALLTDRTEGDWVVSMSFSPDGRILASGSGVGTILLWDMTPYVTSSGPTALQMPPALPTQTALLASYPNPFNGRTRIAYRLAAPGRVRLDTYNAMGQPVRRLVDQSQAAGAYDVHWDALDDGGAPVASGSIWRACTIREGRTNVACSTSGRREGTGHPAPPAPGPYLRSGGSPRPHPPK